MARTSSIFYLAQQNKLGHSTALPVSLNALITPSTSISRFHRERLERVKNDVQAARSVCTTLKQLFEIFWIKPEDLTAAPAAKIFRNVRTFLHQRIQAEVALIGNPVTFSVDSIFRITSSYDLNKDPDIVAAKELQASKRMNTFARHRMEQASQKINNFLLLIHTFETLFLVVDNGKLNGEQGFQINSFLENSIFPTEGKQFLQACFTQVLEQGAIPMELEEGKRFIRPFVPGPMLTNYLKFMARIAVFAYTKPDFSQTPYHQELEAFYNELHMTLRPQNNIFHVNPRKLTTEEENVHCDYAFLSIFTNGRLAAQDYLAHHNISTQSIAHESTPCGVSINGDFTLISDANTQEEVNKFRVSVLKQVKASGFYNPEKLHFHGNNSTIYINDIALNNSNLYVTNCNPNEFSMWNFAINSRFTPTLFFPEKCKTFVQLDQDARRSFAIGISGYNGVFHLSTTIGCTLAGSLEYRLLVEGFLGLINEAERRNAFMWLVQWYNQFFASHDKVMYDFTVVLKYMGDIISLYSYLYPNDITPSVHHILEQHPYTALYHQLEAAQFCAANKIPSSEQLYRLIFQIYINSSDEYNLSLRLSAPCALLLRERAYREFKNFLNLHPKTVVTIKKFTPTLEATHFDDCFGALKYYKNTVFKCLLPNAVQFKPKPQLKKLIETIKQKQKPFINYLQNSGRNVRNEIVFRILEAGLTPEEQLSQGIEVFRRQLLGSGPFSYDELKKSFNISINSRSDVLTIIAECAKICNLSMYPNPAVESYDETISAFDYIMFNEGRTTIPEDAKRFLLPLRLAIDAATSYSTEERILMLFNRHIAADTSYDDEEKAQICDYASKVTKLKQLKGGSCRAGLGLSRITFTEDQKQALIDYFTIVCSFGDPYSTMRNVKAINTKLTNKELSCFLENLKDAPQRGRTRATFGEYRTNNVANWNGVSALFPEESFNRPDNLDQELIAKKMQETNHVRELLAPIFNNQEADSETEQNQDALTKQTVNLNQSIKDEEPNAEGATSSSNQTSPANASGSNASISEVALANQADEKPASPLDDLPAAHRRLLIRLLQLPEFTRAEFKKLCLEEDLMPSAALEVINDWSFATFDCSLIEDDDVMFFDRELLADLNN